MLDKNTVNSAWLQLKFADGGDNLPYLFSTCNLSCSAVRLKIALYVDYTFAS